MKVPIFTLTVEEEGDFIVGVHQKDKRCQDAQEYIDFGVSVLKLDETTGAPACLMLGSCAHAP